MIFKESLYGRIPDEWDIIPLKDLCHKPSGVQTGPFGSQLHQRDYVEQGTPILTVEHLNNNRITHENLPRVSIADQKRLARYTLKTGDIVFSRVGSVDRRSLVRKDEEGWLFSGRCLRVRPNIQKIDPGYLSWFFGLPNFQEYIRRIAVGATMPSLNTDLLGNVEVIVPPLPEQRAIASILGALDDKIELNRQMNRTLEAIAQALFKSWFVDFDPVWAKKEGRQPFGMDADTVALFPADFEESELGLIPVGWTIQSLDQIANFLNGLPLQKYPCRSRNCLPIIKISQLKRGTTQDSDFASADIPADYVIHDGDLLFSWSATLEVRIWVGGDGALNQHLFKVTSETYPQWFYYYWLLQYLPAFREIAADKATTMGHIQRYHLTDAQVVIPPPEILRYGTTHISPLIQKLIANEQESRILAELRDTLLPKLLSGELRVPVETEDEFLQEVPIHDA